MKTLIVFDSLYGNTRKIAKILGKSLNAKVIQAGKVNIAGIKSYDLLIIGCPTHAGRPTAAAQSFLHSLTASMFKNKKIAVYDTRISPEKNVLYKMAVKVFGFAAPKLAQELKGMGVNVIVEPEGFIVEGKEGPLRMGELERAEKWAKDIIKIIDK